MFRSTKNSAKKRGLSNILSKSDIEERLEAQDWKCAKTGIAFDLRVAKGSRPFGPSVDRINNKQGYEPGNIQIVCNIYNFAKNHYSDADVLRLAAALMRKQKK